MDKAVKTFIYLKKLIVDNRNTNLILFFLITNFYIVEAQNDSIKINSTEKNAIITYDSNYTFNFNYAKDVAITTKNTIISPLKWNKKEIIKFSIATISTSGLIFVDKPIQEFFQNNKTDFTKWTTKNMLEPLGSGKYSIPILAIFYTYGAISNNTKSKTVALDGLKAFIVSGICVQIPKYGFQRHRPYQTKELNPYIWDGPVPMISAAYKKYIKNEKNITIPTYKSFPSGHTTSAFAVATVIAEHYKEKKWIVISSYTLASLSALSRIHDNKHWISDVFVGSLLGYACGKFCVHNKNFSFKFK